MKALLILLPLLIAICYLATGCLGWPLGKKSIFAKAKDSTTPYEDINKHLCRNLKSSDPDANIKELLRVYHELEERNLGDSQIAEKLKMLTSLEVYRSQGAHCSGWSRVLITREFPDNKLADLVPAGECNRLTPIFEHYVQLHASECQPGLLNQFNHLLSLFDQTALNLLMSLVDKIVKGKLGVEGRQFTMEDFIGSKGKFGTANGDNPVLYMLELVLVIGKDTVVEMFTQMGGRSEIAAEKTVDTYIRAPCRALVQHFFDVLPDDPDDLGRFPSNLQPTGGDTSEFYRFATLKEFCKTSPFG